MAGPVIPSYRFRTERQDTWTELERLIDRAENQGIASLDDEELQRFPVLYRATLSSLSVARDISLDRNLVDYLESLATRAFLFVYGAKENPLLFLADVVLRRFPRQVWSMRWWVAVSALILAAGTIAGFELTRHDPDLFFTMVPTGLADGRSPLSTRAELEAVIKDHDPVAADDLGFFSSFLFTHNTRIGLMCFVAGLAAAVPVIYLVFSNGLTLGAFAAVHARHDLLLEFSAWIAPHGVTELLAVVICAAAGFRLGVTVVFPGRRRRLMALAEASREAALVVVGAVGMFLVAALLEGYARQWVISDGGRTQIGVITAVVWILYLTPLGDHLVAVLRRSRGR
jgi:uncharacterized membrane protein SpoIIM required for sporulation